MSMGSCRPTWQISGKTLITVGWLATCLPPLTPFHRHEHICNLQDIRTVTKSSCVKVQHQVSSVGGALLNIYPIVSAPTKQEIWSRFMKWNVLRLVWNLNLCWNTLRRKLKQSNTQVQAKANILVIKLHNTAALSVLLTQNVFNWKLYLHNCITCWLVRRAMQGTGGATLSS